MLYTLLCRQARLHQVVLELVYLSILLRAVGGVSMDDGSRAVVLVLWRMRVEDVHRALFLGWKSLGLVVLLLWLILHREVATLYTKISDLKLELFHRINTSHF